MCLEKAWVCWLGKTTGRLAWEAVPLGGGWRNREERKPREPPRSFTFSSFLSSRSWKSGSTIFLAFKRWCLITWDFSWLWAGKWLPLNSVLHHKLPLTYHTPARLRVNHVVDLEPWPPQSTGFIGNFKIPQSPLEAQPKPSKTTCWSKKRTRFCLHPWTCASMYTWIQVHLQWCISTCELLREAYGFRLGTLASWCCFRRPFISPFILKRREQKLRTRTVSQWFMNSLRYCGIRF